MKKIFILIIACLLSFITACNKEVNSFDVSVNSTNNGNTIILEINNIDPDGISLDDLLVKLKQNDKIDYTMNGTMISSINGIDGNGPAYWMIYSNDTEQTNDAWETYSYNDVNYASAAVGSNLFLIHNNQIIIFALISF